MKYTENVTLRIYIVNILDLFEYFLARPISTPHTNTDAHFLGD